MRRGAALALALALCVGGTAACGGDDGGGDAAGGATTVPPTDPIGDDLTAAVEDFCAQTEELQALILAQGEAQSGAAGPADPSASAAAEGRVSDLSGEVVGTMLSLQGKVSEMLPSDAARFQECSAVFSG